MSPFINPISERIHDFCELYAEQPYGNGGEGKAGKGKSSAMFPPTHEHGAGVWLTIKDLRQVMRLSWERGHHESDQAYVCRQLAAYDAGKHEGLRNKAAAVLLAKEDGYRQGLQDNAAATCLAASIVEAREDGYRQGLGDKAAARREGFCEGFHMGHEWANSEIQSLEEAERNIKRRREGEP